MTIIIPILDMCILVLTVLILISMPELAMQIAIWKNIEYSVRKKILGRLFIVIVANSVVYGCCFALRECAVDGFLVEGWYRTVFVYEIIVVELSVICEICFLRHSLPLFNWVVFGLSLPLVYFPFVLRKYVAIRGFPETLKT